MCESIPKRSPENTHSASNEDANAVTELEKKTHLLSKLNQVVRNVSEDK